MKNTNHDIWAVIFFKHSNGCSDRCRKNHFHAAMEMSTNDWISGWENGMFM